MLNTRLTIKLLFLIFSWVFFIRGSLQAQASNKIYHAWVKSGRPTLRGYLYKLQDDVVVLKTRKTPEIPNVFEIPVPIENITTLQFRRKGKRLKSLVIGAVSGAGIGFLIGRVSEEPKCNGLGCIAVPTKEVSGLIGGTYLGIIAGYIIGGAKINIPINGSQGTYEAQREKLRTYLRQE